MTLRRIVVEPAGGSEKLHFSPGVPVPSPVLVALAELVEPPPPVVVEVPVSADEHAGAVVMTRVRRGRARRGIERREVMLSASTRKR
jgi:hypothetical protein